MQTNRALPTHKYQKSNESWQEAPKEVVWLNRSLIKLILHFYEILETDKLNIPSSNLLQERENLAAN